MIDPHRGQTEKESEKSLKTPKIPLKDPEGKREESILIA
jgi:hypothetical protein